MIFALNFFSTRSWEFFINFSLVFFEEMSFWIASVSFCGLFGGTSNPVFSFSIISGIPPVLDAIIGRPETIASRITMPKASRTDGRTKKSAVFIKYGMFF